MKVLEKRHEVLSDFMEPVELVDQMDLFAPKGLIQESSELVLDRHSSSWHFSRSTDAVVISSTTAQSLPQAPPKCRPTTQGKDGDTNVHSHVAADWTQRKASKPLVCFKGNCCLGSAPAVLLLPWCLSASRHQPNLADLCSRRWQTQRYFRRSLTVEHVSFP